MFRYMMELHFDDIRLTFSAQSLGTFISVSRIGNQPTFSSVGLRITFVATELLLSDFDKVSFSRFTFLRYINLCFLYINNTFNIFSAV